MQANPSIRPSRVIPKIAAAFGTCALLFACASPDDEAPSESESRISTESDDVMKGLADGAGTALAWGASAGVYLPASGPVTIPFRGDRGDKPSFSISSVNNRDSHPRARLFGPDLKPVLLRQTREAGGAAGFAEENGLQSTGLYYAVFDQPRGSGRGADFFNVRMDGPHKAAGGTLGNHAPCNGPMIRGYGPSVTCQPGLRCLSNACKPSSGGLCSSEQDEGEACISKSVCALGYDCVEGRCTIDPNNLPPECDVYTGRRDR